jgi:hypothetical protein
LPGERQSEARAAQAGVQGLVGVRRGIEHQIRVIQRRAYGLRDEEYLRLKILTSTLPVL